MTDGARTIVLVSAHIVPDPPYVVFVASDRVLFERVGQALYTAGFVPLLAADSRDAVDYMAGGSTPVLVIVDLDSVGLEPDDLLARFRADARWARVPVVVVGSAIPGRLSVDGALSKPFDAEALVALARNSVAWWKAPERRDPGEAGDGEGSEERRPAN